MVINEKKPPEMPNKEEVKQQILQALSQESYDVIALAYNYVKGFELSGDDVTKKWENVSYNMASIKEAYSKGFHAGLEFYSQQKEEVEKRKLEIWMKQQEENK